MTYVVKDFMSGDIVTVEVEMSVAEASKKIAENPRGYAIALDGGQPAGMVTEQDVVKKVVAEGLDPSETKVSQVMSSPLITVDLEEELMKAAEIMKNKNVRKLPVVQDGIIYGVITARDITDHFSDYVDKTMRDIIRWSPLGFWKT